VTVSAAPASAYAGPANKWAIAVAVSLGALLEVIDTSIVNVALADIQSSLGATLTQVSWVVSSYSIANVIILPLSAWLGQRYGKKNYFIFSLIGFTIASMLCGTATTFPMLVVARVIQGLAGGGLLAKAQAILFETFPKEEQAKAQALFGAIVIAGPTIGPTLGGYLVTNVDWRWIFFVNLPVGIFAVLMTMAALPKDPENRTASRVDWLAIFLLAGGLGSLQTVLEEGQTDDWFQSPFIVMLSISAVVGLGAFVWRELVTERPVVDLRVLRYRSLWVGSVLSVVVGMALFGALFAVPLFAQTMLGYTSQDTGLLLLPGALASTVAMPLGARILRKVEARMMLLGGSIILAVALLQLNQLTPQTGESNFFWPLIIRSFGTVFMFLPLSLLTLGGVPKKDVAAASGFYSLTRQLGGSVGVALLSTLLSQRQAFHRNVLIEKVIPSDSLTMDRIAAFTHNFLAKGFPLEEARQQAMSLLDHTVDIQAMVMAFADTFSATAVLVFVAMPLILLMPKPDLGNAKAAAEAH
jgi:DHA2 family multidrug resistance protein